MMKSITRTWSRVSLTHSSLVPRLITVAVLAFMLGTAGCSKGNGAHTEAEEEAMARTEFTDRIENYFEYEPLKAGKQSQFLIHLSDLSDGTPVEKAEVTLTARPKGSGATGGTQIKARVGKVTGIYVADVT